MRTYKELEVVLSREVEFKRWLPDNMHTYISFVNYARQLRRRGGRNYYSARAIWERLRWDSMIRESPQGTFKINGNHVPFTSWLVMEAEPDLAGMFRKRAKDDLW